MTSKQLVLDTLNFQNKTQRVPHDLWTLPWVNDHYPKELQQLLNSFEWDFDRPDVVYHEASAVEKGDPYEVGEYIDPWGCVFKNINKGVIGEVKQPLMNPDDEEWDDTSGITIPEE